MENYTLTETDTIEEIAVETRDEKKAKASAATGLAPEKFQGIHLKLDVLREQGVLIDVNIIGTGMLSRAVSWADLGLADIEEDKRSTQIHQVSENPYPGWNGQAPESVKARMRQALERNSYKITEFAPYRWLPFTSYAHFKAEIIQDRSMYVDEWLPY